MPRTVIISTARTPFGKMGGGLAPVDATADRPSGSSDASAKALSNAAASDRPVAAKTRRKATKPGAASEDAHQLSIFE